MIDNILKENKDLKLNNNMITYLKVLESIIPEEYRTNFYNNLKTLKVFYNNNLKNELTGATGKYIEKTNTIILETEYITNQFKNKDIENIELLKTIEQCFLHEFVHMASSSYDKETDTLISGYEQKHYPTAKALTEGMAEFLSLAIVKPKYGINTGYNIETNIINQLYQVLGNDLIKSFFSGSRTTLLENDLKRLNNNEESIKTLLQEIENISTLKDSKYDSDSLSIVQDLLLDFLDKKLESLENKEEIEKYLYNYSNILITSESIKTITNDYKKYIDLDKNEQKFEDIKNKYSYSKTK